jgi:hypothetical protein
MLFKIKNNSHIITNVLREVVNDVFVALTNRIE